MSDRVEYIRRRLDELEAAAKAAGESRIAWLTYRDADGAMLYTTVAAEASDGTWLAAGAEVPAPASVLTVYDPAAVLARVAADRAALARLVDVEPCTDSGDSTVGDLADDMVRLMAEGLGWKDDGDE